MRRWILNLISAFLILGLGLLYYYATENNLVNPFLFPKVSAIAKAFSKNQDIMLINLISSLGMMIPSILISLTIALSVGIILGRNAVLRDILHPVLYIFSVVPSILLSPFVLLLAPNFWVASVFLIVYSTVWSTLFATITGIMTIDKRYLDKAATLELKGMKKITKVILPAASPSILSGFVNSLRNTFVMLVYAEMYGSRYGMGFFVKKYTDFSLYDHAWGGFLFMVLVLVIVMQFFDRLKEYLLRWTID
ncbi:MAG: ABC transporter permease subunit [Synergistaceae bacterium]|nr:ABC transporter permease subunit [Synergistaceae bacterium]MBR0095044.1 ABC transporter permease subunit [Synergistaceae bacterium]